MTKDIVMTILANYEIANKVYKMYLKGDVSCITRPGQFVNIKLDGHYLRRPISVCDVNGDVLTIVYKVVGVGTEAMSSYLPGKKLEVLVGLGNGYDVEKSGKTPLLIGGGVGVPPLYNLARHLIARGATPKVILGFNSESDVILLDEFRALGLQVGVTTADGSFGTPGFVTALIPDNGYSYIYSCGPIPMLKAIAEKSATSGQFSFEERMGCGFGACMGCTCETKYGYKRICRDGPVLEKEEIIW